MKNGIAQIAEPALERTVPAGIRRIAMLRGLCYCHPREQAEAVGQQLHLRK